MKHLVIKVLDWIQRTFHIDATYFATNGFWTFLQVGVQSIYGLIFTWLIANYLSKEVAGQFFWLLAIFGFFSLFSCPGIHTVNTNQFLKKDYSDYFLGPYRQAWYSLGGLIIGTGFMLLFVPQVVLLNWKTFLIFGFFFPLSNFFTYIRLLYAQDRFRALFVSILLRSILQIAGYVLVLIISPSLNWFLLVHYAIPVFFDICASIIFRPKQKIGTKSSLVPSLKFFFSFAVDFKNNAWQLSIFYYAQLLLQILDKIIIGYFLNFVTVAIFALASFVLRIFLQLFDKSILFLFYKKLTKYSWKQSQEKVIVLAFTILVLVSATYFLIPTIYVLLFPTYMEGIWISQILLFVVPLIFINNILQRYFESRNDSRTLLLVNGIITILYAILLYTFVAILNLEIHGVIIALFVKEFLLMLFYWINAQKIE